MVHDHTNVNINTSLTTHAHPHPYTGLTNCGYGAATHRHQALVQGADGHFHVATIQFGYAALGSPNWWEHAHPIRGSLTLAGSVHPHVLTSPTTGVACSLCTGNPHSHPHGLSADNGGGPHNDHAFNGFTDYADASGTPENHTHTFSVTFELGNEHNHTISGTVSNVNCYRGYSHTHTRPLETDYVMHSHSGSGTSGSGGESPAVVMRVFGDGFCWICG